MPLQVLPAKGPADMYRCAVTERHTYDTYPANGVLFPGPFPADVLVTRGKELEAQCNNDDGGIGSCFFFKVVDTDLDEIVAFSKWSVFCVVFFSAPPRGLWVRLPLTLVANFYRRPHGA